MIEGVDYDDMYRMVEDEFLAVAKDFTRHLHAAEYQRLKGLAKSQNAETIQNISRPVTGEMTGLVKRRRAALDTASKQRNGIADFLDKRAAGNGSKTERQPPRRQATSLQGLMDSPRKQNVPLTLMPGSRPGSRHREAVDVSPSRKRPNDFDSHRTGRNTNIETVTRQDGAVSARSNREPSTESEEDDDDLDGQPHWPPKRVSERPVPAARPPIPQQPSSRPPARTESRPTGVETPFVGKSVTERRGLPSVAPLSEPANLPPLDNGEEDVFAGLQARRAERKRRRETKAQESTTKTSETQAAALNSIPFI